MSLMKTLAKVAIGVAVAKGAKSMMNNKGRASGGLGGLLGGLTSTGAAGASRPGTGRPASGAQGSGSLQDMLGGLLGGSGRSGSSGGLGGLLEKLGGHSTNSGGLAGMLGGLAGAGAAGSTASPSLRKYPEKQNADFGHVLNSQFDGNDEAEIEPSQDQEALAGLMLTAMIQAAKSDGTFDDDERERLLTHLGEVDSDDMAFINAQMQKPVDVDALVADTPSGMGPQIYAMSLLAIDLDTQAEAQYLHKLAQGYGMTPAEVNTIHDEMGVPTLYT